MHSNIDIKGLIKKFGLKDGMVYPDFFMYRLNDIDIDILNQDNNVFHTSYFDVTLASFDEGTLVVGKNSYSDLNNTISFVSPGQIFSYRNTGNRINGIGLLFKPEFISKAMRGFELQNEFQFFKIYTSSIYKLSKEQLNVVSDIFEKMYDEYKLNGFDSRNIIQSYLDILLYTVRRFVNIGVNKVSITRSEEISSAFEELVMKYSAKQNSVADYAAMLNISEVYLYECVKSTTGRSPKRVITDYRVLVAKWLLTEGESSISTVSYKLGFDETTNFTKFFKKYVGVTPKEFKRIH
ncbi:MAG: AraC family transcriptional regulator [Bacteroidales bacterium]|jgi:AraC-like DNA-binding protein|nr:AraC family transcriptional regulator [Bacteroidales bacterium]